MKIAIVDTSGSLPQFIEPLVASLRKQNEVMIVGDGYRNNAIQFYKSQIIKKLLLIRVAYILIRVFYVCFLLKKNKFTVVNLHWVEIPIIWYFCCKFFDLTIVYTIHNAKPAHGIKTLRNMVANLGRNILIRYSCANIVLSRYGKRIVDKICEKPSVFIHHGLIHRRTKKKKLFGNKSITLLSLGIVSEYKRVDELLEVFIEQPQKTCNLVIAGSVRHSHALDLLNSHKQKRNLQVYNEYVSDEDFHTYLYSADILVLNHSEIDSSGILFSALDSNIIIAARNIGGFNEFLTHEKNAFLYNDVKELFVALKENYFNDTKKARLEKGKMELLSEWPSWDNIATAYEEVFTHARK